MFIGCDFIFEDEVKVVVEEIEMMVGCFDVLVNNVGGFIEVRGIEEIMLEEWGCVIDFNLILMFFMIRVVFLLFCCFEVGWIINFGLFVG